MALSKPELKRRIIEEMEIFGASTASRHSWLSRFAEAMANAIVDEMQENAEVDGGSDDPDGGGESGGGGGIK